MSILKSIDPPNRWSDPLYYLPGISGIVAIIDTVQDVALRFFACCVPVTEAALEVDGSPIEQSAQGKNNPSLRNTIEKRALALLPGIGNLLIYLYYTPCSLHPRNQPSTALEIDRLERGEVRSQEEAFADPKKGQLLKRTSLRRAPSPLPFCALKKNQHAQKDPVLDHKTSLISSKNLCSPAPMTPAIGKMQKAWIGTQDQGKKIQKSAPSKIAQQDPLPSFPSHQKKGVLHPLTREQQMGKIRPKRRSSCLKIMAQFDANDRAFLQKTMGKIANSKVIKNQPLLQSDSEKPNPKIDPIEQDFGPLSQGNEASVPVTSRVTTFIRNPGHQTCWALTALHIGMFTDPYLAQEIKTFLEQAHEQSRDHSRIAALAKIITKYEQHVGGSIDIAEELQTVFADLVQIYDQNGVSETRKDQILTTQLSTAEMLQGLFSLFERNHINIEHLKTSHTYLMNDGVATNPSDFTVIPINLIKQKHQPPEAPLSIETLIDEQLAFTTLPDTLHFRMVREYPEDQHSVEVQPRPEKSYSLTALKRTSEGDKGSKKSKEPRVFVKKYVPNPIFFPSNDGAIGISSKEISKRATDGQMEVACYHKPKSYELQAFAIHGNIHGDAQTTIGPLTSCHYVSCVKKGSQWFFINDDVATPISDEEAMRRFRRCATATFKKVKNAL
ncbi:MAG: ubiquitin carboxyl-terminal hydrolase family protein [Chlamydiota bacterium]